MNIGIVFFTDKGSQICEKIVKNMGTTGKHTFELREKNEKLSQWTKRCFEEKEGIIFISATGIAVRSIAPYIVSKTKDPAVLVIDDVGNFVISLLSGHVGGANKLALEIGKAIGAEPVITTATDASKKLAIDGWAVENKLIIDDIKPAKDIAMEILRDEKIYVRSDVKLETEDENIILIDDRLYKNIKTEEVETEDIAVDDLNKLKLGVNISYRRQKFFQSELWLIPKIITLGIGCRRGKSKEDISVLVDEVLRKENIDKRSIKNIASIDLKKDEEGLIDFAREMGVDFITYTSDELKEAEGDFEKSDFVNSITGVDNVCQRAAVLGSGKGRVIVKKLSREGVTLSIAVEDIRLKI